MEILGSHLGIPGQNDIWVLVPWPDTKYIIRGKVVASPKSRLWWVLWVRVYSWWVHAPRCSNYALTNLLFVLCKSVWVIEMLVNLLSPIMELQHAPLPLKSYEPRSTLQFFLLSLSSPLGSQLNLSRAWGCITLPLAPSLHTQTPWKGGIRSQHTIVQEYD